MTDFPNSPLVSVLQITLVGLGSRIFISLPHSALAVHEFNRHLLLPEQDKQVGTDLFSFSTSVSVLLFKNFFGRKKASQVYGICAM